MAPDECMLISIRCQKEMCGTKESVTYSRMIMLFGITKLLYLARSEMQYFDLKQLVLVFIIFCIILAPDKDYLFLAMARFFQCSYFRGNYQKIPSTRSFVKSFAH